MRIFQAAVTAALLLSIGVPARAAVDGTVVVSTETKVVIKDERGDQGTSKDATRVERRAADIRRIKAWQGDRSGWVSMTFRGSIVASGVQKWYSAVTLSHRDGYEHPGFEVNIRRDHSYVRIFQIDGSQIICNRTPTLITNRGRTVTTRIPRGCQWQRAHRLFAYTTVDRSRFRQMAGDSVAARCGLVWR